MEIYYTGEEDECHCAKCTNQGMLQGFLLAMARQPLNPEEMNVRVALPTEDGYTTRDVTVKAICPQCGGPRGTPTRRTYYMPGGKAIEVDTWWNPCGHYDMHDNVYEEAHLLEAEKAYNRPC